MVNSLKNKITIPVIGIVFLMIVIIVVYVSMSTANLVDDFTDDRMTAATQAVRAYLDAHNQQYCNRITRAGRSNCTNRRWDFADFKYNSKQLGCFRRNSGCIGRTQFAS